MNEYIISIISVIVLTGVAAIILPDGRLGKFVKGIFAILTLVVILSPITAFFSDDIDYNGDIFDEKEMIINSEFLDYIDFKRKENYQTDLEKMLDKLGYESDVEIYYTSEDYKFKVTKVLINLKNSVMKDEYGHIVISEEIFETVCTYLSIERNSVEIYEDN